MNALLFGIWIQWKLDLRNRNNLLTYYAVPLLFFLFMGGIFSSILPDSKATLIQSMVVFGVSMGAFLGTPAPLVDVFTTEIKKAYIIGGIPLWSVVVNNTLSAFIHLSLMALIILLGAAFIFGATLPENPSTFFAAQSLFILASIGVGTVLGLYSPDHTKLTLLSQMVFLPSIMLGGIMFPASLLPSALQTVGNVFPATWGFIATTTNSLDFNGLYQLLICLFLSAITVAIRLYQHSRA